jgi:signal transduction histidine kinase
MKRTIIAVVVGIGTCAFGVFCYYTSPSRGLPYGADFNSSSTERWSTFGGTWEVVDGSIQNDSDDRGAKLLMGSPYWKNYTIDADVQLLGLGDAGIIARVSQAELGVDAYNGYYAGLRTMDESLVLGHANHGWEEYSPVRMPGGVQPFHWYHLTLAVYGCRIAAAAVDRTTGKRVSIVYNASACASSGRVGLRSYTSGGVWRNVIVTPLTSPALPAPRLVDALPPPEGSSHQRSLLAGYVSGSPVTVPFQADVSHAQPISSLRYLSPIRVSRARVRGVVVLTEPTLYVEDNTGGIAVEPQSSPSLKIGDEVEVFGEIEPHTFSSILKGAEVHLLWEAAPNPPLSITANQAATGVFDGMFIQTEGRLKQRATRRGSTISLDLESEQQEFRAVFNVGRSASHLSDIYPGSILRLRGICVSDSLWTNNLTPFVVLIRSADDIQMVAGPPWWSWNTLVPFALLALVVIGVAYHVLLLARHWRLQAILEERSRLAHEIHDTLAQSFAGISFQMQAICASVPPDMPLLNEQVRLAWELVRHSHEEARHGIASLRPESLEATDLLSALEKSATKMIGSGEIAIQTSREGNALMIPLRIKDILFRIGHEALANAVRHSRARCIRISTIYKGSTLGLVIEDDGCGFDVTVAHSGFGLAGMRERARSIDAKLTINSRSGSGTRVEVTAHLPTAFSLKSCYHWLRNVWGIRARLHSYSYR